MRLIIVRHGETEANVGRILQGQRNNPLSARGRQQAAELAKRMVGEGIEVVISSDLSRARETAESISAAIGVPIEFSEQLRERSYGEFEGRPVSDYEKALVASGLAREAFLPDGGESLIDLENRVADFLKFISVKLADKTVLLVAHSGTNRALIKVLLKREFADWLAVDQDNACVNIFDIAEDAVTTVLSNCTAHLVGVGFTEISAYE